jgi:hypothetical protein
VTVNGQDGSNVSIALIHYPVYNKHRQVVATAITNLDLHDIARTARTFGLHRYYVVTPLDEQRQLAERIASHWLDGWGATYNPMRKEALELIRIVASLDAVLEEIGQSFGRPAKVVATGAVGRAGSIGSDALATMVADTSQPYLLLMGTGWGLADEVFEQADLVLAPIRGGNGYNHLPVRSAAAIILDRLLGTRQGDTGETDNSADRAKFFSCK